MSRIIVGFFDGKPVYTRDHPPKAEKAAPPAPALGAPLRQDAASVDAKGRFVAVFSTFNVIDADGDVTMPEAFARQRGKSVVVSAYGHSSWDGVMPLGSGTIHSTSTHAEIRGHLLLDTEAGRHMHSVLKDHGSELSYGYVVLDSARGSFRGEPVRFLKDVEVFEVSFVLRGAGRGTGVIELDDDLKGLSPEAREAITDYRRLEARIEYAATRAGKARPPDMERVYGFKVPPGMQPRR